MSHSTYSWLKAGTAVPAAALVALALAGPASAQATADTTAPSAPTHVTSTYYSDKIVDDITWTASTDPDNASQNLTYVVQTDDPYCGTVTVTGSTSAVCTHTFSVTIWAVDPAGNKSPKVTVQTKTV